MSRVRVKICGLTRARDVEAVVEAGADAAGFVFADSKRRLEAHQAVLLARLVPAGVLRVGLFMDQPANDIDAVLEAVPLDLLQFHGRETNEFCRGFGLPFIKAIPMSGTEPAVECHAFPDAVGLLFDSHGPGGAGGTGRTLDWASIPRCEQKVWLAGGLTPGNVAEAIRAVQPWAVDVSSGVEASPGVKRSDLIHAFVRAARAVDNRQQPTR